MDRELAALEREHGKVWPINQRLAQARQRAGVCLACGGRYRTSHASTGECILLAVLHRRLPVRAKPGCYTWRQRVRRYLSALVRFMPAGIETPAAKRAWLRKHGPREITSPGMLRDGHYPVKVWREEVRTALGLNKPVKTHWVDPAQQTMFGG